MSRNALVGALLAVAAGAAVYFLWPEEQRSPEDEVRRLVGALVAEAEKKSPSGVVSHLDPGFRGPSGADVQQVKQLLVGQFFRARQVTVLNPLLEVEVRSPDSAHFSGTFVLTRDGQVDSWEFEGDVQRGDDGWKVVSASWKR